jgi:Xaa-Pro aminopeptidase
VRVAGTFPTGVTRALERAGIRVRVSREPLLPERAVKTREEVGKIKEAQQAAVIAMRTAISMIAKADVNRHGVLRVGQEVLTSEWVKKVINRTLLEHLCIGKDTIVACGHDASQPHEQGSGPLRAHETIVIDIFPQHMDHGYWGDLTRTVVHGTAPPAVKRIYTAVRAAQNAALAHVKPGVSTSTIHKRAVEEFDRRGFRRTTVDGQEAGFIHGTGHGVGLEIHEAPRVGSSGARVRRGHVFTVEPGLYYPDLGGVRIEDTIVVTPKGWQYLVPCEKRLEV